MAILAMRRKKGREIGSPTDKGANSLHELDADSQSDSATFGHILTG